MAKYDYNLMVIGAGSGGLVTSYIAAVAGAKIALIEKHKMGGDCLNTGCVPSKALLRSASFMRDVHRASSLGFRQASADFDFAEIMERVSSKVQAIEPHDSIERYTSLGVECIVGEGKIESPHHISVEGKTYSTRSMVIAAGARPFIPEIDNLDKVSYYTSDTIWSLRQSPKRLLVIGGGPIGCELAQAFSYLGADVTQIHRGDRVLGREDNDVTDIVGEHLRSAGVNVLLNAAAQAVEIDDNGEKFLIVHNQENGEVSRIPFDTLLFAVGREANGKRVSGLEEAGVVVDKRGAIKVNTALQTSVPNIFACGDIIGSYQFTHTAGHAAVYAAINSLSPLPFKKKVDWSLVPWCTFTFPEVARVGLSENEAKESGLVYEITKYNLDDLDRAITDSEAEGFVKLITSPSGKILGVTIVGHHAGDIIHEYIIAMKNNLSLKSILSTIHIYPTLAEGNRFAASEWSKKRLSKNFLSLSAWINKKMRG